jgi:CPA2 family monovalent cation:H+ antiporter-2
VGGIIAHRLRQPVILGYLVIGAIVGPHSLGLVGDIDLVKALAAIGVTLLMFTLGMEISVSQLRDVGKVGIWGGIIQIGAVFLLGMLLGVTVFRWSLPQSSLFGLIISLSSTAVGMKVLMERGEMSSVHGRIMLAILILQDISVILMMIILPVLEGVTSDIPMTVLKSAGMGFLFVGFAIVLGRWVIPWLLGRVSGPRTRELFIMTVLVLCLAAAIITEIAGLSVVFGAFLIGLVMRDTRFVHQALAEVTPLRDIFTTLFFVSLGMLLDPKFLLENWQFVLMVVGIIIAIKLLVVFGVVRIFGYSSRVAVLAGAGLFQIGEFGFILAQGGVDQGFTTGAFYSLIISSAIITMLLTPVSVSAVCKVYPRIVTLFNRRKPVITVNAFDQTPGIEAKSMPVVIAGYGRVGEAVAVGLEDAEIPFVIVDVDPERVSDPWYRPSLYFRDAITSMSFQSQSQRRQGFDNYLSDPLAVETTVKMA